MATRIDHDEFNGTARFRLERRLGAGSFGVVYQAFDYERQTCVALKVLRQALLRESPEVLYRFKREFRALADVVHPNLVALYELISDVDQWFFTMELVRGTHFINYILAGGAEQLIVNTLEMGIAEETLRPIDSLDTVRIAAGQTPVSLSMPPKVAPQSGEHRFDEARLRSAIAQLANGVHALHSAGKLHRDLKPSNILVTEQGRVVILDFGLVAELMTSAHESQQIVGTPTHMSPEQANGEAITRASDWYSVGVVLYQALTGRLPFTGQYLEVILKKQQEDPAPPSEVNPRAPADLSDLCMQLLARDAAKRPNGAEILHYLHSHAEAAGAVRLTAPARARRKAALIGRERHLAELKRAWLATRNGVPVTLFLHGSSGMGKSVLAHHFLETLKQSEGAHLVVLEGRCYEQEAVPYKALDSLVDALSNYLKVLPGEEAERLIPADVLALAKLFPVLQQVEAIAQARRDVLAIPDSQELRRRAFIALRELLTRLGTTRSLVLFLDDLQWGDSDSAALLGELLRPPDPPLMLLIASYRSEDAHTSVMLRAFLALRENFATLETRELEIDKLSDDKARELALLLLKEHNPDADIDVAAIVTEAGGSPFFINELACHSQAGNKSQPDMAGPVSLDSVLQARMLALPPEARRLLEFIAVAGQPLDRAVARMVAGLKETEQAALALLRAGNLIRIIETGDQEELETYHDRIRESAVAQIESATLCDMHRALALALESHGHAAADRLTIHFQRAGDIEKTAKYADIAAEQAYQALAFARAAYFYKLALEMHNRRVHADAETLARLRVRLGDSLANAGRGAEAARAYQAASADCARAAALELQRRAAEQLLISGHIDEGLVTLREVLAGVGFKLPENLLLQIASLVIQRVRVRVRSLKYSERDGSQIPAEELTAIDICWSASIGLGMVDRLRVAEFQARHLLMALNTGEPYRVARALAVETGYVAAFGSRTWRRTERLMNRALALATRVRNPHAQGLALFMGGLATFCVGYWRKCQQFTEEAEEILRKQCTGVTWELDSTYLFLLRSLFWLGDLNKICYRLPELLKDAHERGDLYCQTNMLARAAYIADLVNDEPARANEELEQAVALWSQQGVHMQHIFALVGRVEVAVYCGQGAVAWQIIADNKAAFDRSIMHIQHFAIELSHLRARAALALAATASGDRESYVRQAESDARRIEKEAAIWGTPLAYLIRAACAALRNKREDAIDLLSLAIAGFDIADMSLYGMAARKRLGQLTGDRVLIDAADAGMARQHIIDRDRFTDMLAPGIKN